MKFIKILLLSIGFSIAASSQIVENPDPLRFQKEIDNFNYWDQKNALPEHFVLMIGSSSIRMWPSMKFFPDLKIVNRGFGGAHISDLIYFQKEILLNFPEPQSIVFYCGGNDIAGSKPAEQVYRDFNTFLGLVHTHAPHTALIYIPVKPCPNRWHLWEEASWLNHMINSLATIDPLLVFADIVTPMLATGEPPDSSLFLPDMLHMSQKGYTLWTSAVRPHLDLSIQNFIVAKQVLYEEMTPATFRKRLAEVPIAYLPLGTLEWHGEHLPVGSDGLQAKHFFEILAAEAGGVVLPMLYLGPDKKKKVNGRELYGMDLGSMHWEEEHKYADKQLDGSAYWISNEDFQKYLEATWKQLARAGFKVVVTHGHGPSTTLAQKNFKEWEKKYGMRFLTCRGADDAKGLGFMVDHAAMNETSLMMAMRPELVQMENLPADSTQWPLGIGGKDPRIHASPELGERIIHRQIKNMSKLLHETLQEMNKNQ